jgi:DNA topoisomerase VI subunit B
LISNSFPVCNSNKSVSTLPSKPVEPSPGPHTKGDDEIRQMAEAIMDEVVDKLLNEAAEVVLREY